MKVVILCGGKGTRLREETEFRPKPMVDIGGRPILWHIMKLYAHFGYHQFVLCLGYRGHVIKEYFLNYDALNNDFTIALSSPPEVEYHLQHREQQFRVTLVDTGLETMTGGRVKRVASFIEDEHFMVTYGDGLADLDLGRLVEFHRQHGRLATITAVRPISRFGILDVADGGAVKSFSEKPASPGWASAGFFVFHRDALRYFDDAPSCVMEREPLERLTADGQLMAYRHDGFFFAMDTYREYCELNALWDGGRPPWKVWS